MNRAYRVALICGAVPLVFGVSIFLLWLITHWDWLMMAGIFTLYSGLVIFAVGVIALARFHWLALRTPDVLRRRLRLATLVCAGLLLANLLIAGAIIATVVATQTAYTVAVHNTSPQPLDRVRVFGGGCDASFGSIPPQNVARRSFWIQHDGELEFQAVSGTTSYAKTIDGYVTNSVGGHTTVTINPDGTISVTNKKT
ncbi:MAG: hypothetical protein ACHRXM_23275 [Isosphaerales bacterium]